MSEPPVEETPSVDFRLGWYDGMHLILNTSQFENVEYMEGYKKGKELLLNVNTAMSKWPKDGLDE